MDLAAGARRVIVAMEHSSRIGEPKIVPECTYPLTGRQCVSMIVTDVAVLDVGPDGGGLVLREYAPGWGPDAVAAATGAPLRVADDVSEYELL